MDLEEYRPRILEFLKTYNESRRSLSIGLIQEEVSRIVESEGHYSELNYQEKREEKDKIRQIVWDLIFERILTPGLDEANPNLPFLSITEYGKKVLSTGEILPYDPDGYLRHLKSEIPSIDLLINMYVNESLQAFLRGLMFSSAVTLGAASEKAFNLLHEALANAITDPTKKAHFIALQGSYRTKSKFDEVKREIISISARLPRNLQENLESNLDGIFNVIRVTRNDAGHPTGNVVKRDSAFVNLRLFIPYCKTVYDLIDWLNTNNI